MKLHTGEKPAAVLVPLNMYCKIPVQNSLMTYVILEISSKETTTSNDKQSGQKESLQACRKTSRQQHITGLLLTHCLRSATLPRSECQFGTGSRHPVSAGSYPWTRCCWDSPQHRMLGAAWFRHHSHRPLRALFHSHLLSLGRTCSLVFHGACCRTVVRMNGVGGMREQGLG